MPDLQQAAAPDQEERQERVFLGLYRLCRWLQIRLRRQGRHTNPERSAEGFSTPEAERLAAIVFAKLMQLDCAGQAGFWNTDAGLKLDGNVSACRSLRRGATVNAIDGQSYPWHNPIGLIDRIESACAADKPIAVGYLGGDPDSYIQCASDIKLPKLVRLVRE